MNVTLDLPDEIYQRLERQAQARNTTLAEAFVQMLAEVEALQVKAFWEKMEAKGLVAKRKPAPSGSDEPFEPITVQGKPISETIIEERR